MIQPVLTRVDPKFHELCFTIQNERIIKGKESAKDKMSTTRITKLITNMINSNLKMFNSLVEADNGKFK